MSRVLGEGYTGGVKACTKCGKTKPLDAFARDALGREGRKAKCRECHAEYDRKRHVKDPQRRSKAWASWASKNRAKLRWAQIERYYGLTQADYAAILAAQGGKCAGPDCDAVPTDVDHDHECCPTKPTCGRCVRGLLCRSCNKRDVLKGNEYYVPQSQGLQVHAE